MWESKRRRKGLSKGSQGKEKPKEEILVIKHRKEMMKV